MTVKNKRNHCISTRVNSAELEALDLKRHGMQRGAFLRACFLSSIPPLVPEINKKLWQELARSASNLNQIALRLNMQNHVEMNEVLDALRDFRITLISHKLF